MPVYSRRAHIAVARRSRNRWLPALLQLLSSDDCVAEQVPLGEGTSGKDYRENVRDAVHVRIGGKQGAGRALAAHGACVGCQVGAGRIGWYPPCWPTTRFVDRNCIILASVTLPSLLLHFTMAYSDSERHCSWHGCSTQHTQSARTIRIFVGLCCGASHVLPVRDCIQLQTSVHLGTAYGTLRLGGT